jgi:hypothetical protein
VVAVAIVATRCIMLSCRIDHSSLAACFYVVTTQCAVLLGMATYTVVSLTALLLLQRLLLLSPVLVGATISCNASGVGVMCFGSAAGHGYHLHSGEYAAAAVAVAAVAVVADVLTPHW